VTVSAQSVATAPANKRGRRLSCIVDNLLATQTTAGALT
jgi:hypothetical protein